MDDHQESLFDTRDRASRSPSSASDAVALLGLSRVRGMAYGGLRSLYEQLPHVGLIAELPAEDVSRLFSLAHIRGAGDLANEWSRDRDRYLSLGRTAYERLAHQGVQLIFDGDPQFPRDLITIPNPVYWLFVEGNLDLLCAPSVAVVGTRRPSQTGIRAAQQLSGYLADWGQVVVSGLAEGIDAAAHQVAVDYGAPTVAVLGTGISVIFPAVTAGLRQRIVDTGGAVITEYLPDDSYSRQRFVLRNRIQAGLATAVCPVEAGAKSGTAHTLDYAVKFRRKLFGVFAGQSDPSNEVIEVIRQRGGRVFDMDDSHQLVELREFLHVRSPQLDSPEPTVSRDRLFDSLVREFTRLVSQYPVSDGDVQALLERLSDEWRSSHHGQDRK